MADDGRTQPAYLRCPWPLCSFVLPVPAEPDANCMTFDLQLSLRLPKIPGQAQHQGIAVVQINDLTIAQLALTERWSRSRVQLPRAALRPGLNRLTLCWPLPPVSAGS